MNTIRCFTYYVVLWSLGLAPNWNRCNLTLEPGCWRNEGHGKSLCHQLQRVRRWNSVWTNQVWLRSRPCRYSVFCEKQGVKASKKWSMIARICTAFQKAGIAQETPTVMIYPPNPVPAFKIDGKLEGKASSEQMYRKGCCRMCVLFFRNHFGSIGFVSFCFISSGCFQQVGQVYAWPDRKDHEGCSWEC